jgi:hypothetical protein
MVFWIGFVRGKIIHFEGVSAFVKTSARQAGGRRVPAIRQPKRILLTGVDAGDGCVCVSAEAVTRTAIGTWIAFALGFHPHKLGSVQLDIIGRARKPYWRSRLRLLVLHLHARRLYLDGEKRKWYRLVLVKISGFATERTEAGRRRRAMWNFRW